MTMILLMKLPRYATRRRTISLIAIPLIIHARVRQNVSSGNFLIDFLRPLPDGHSRTHCYTFPKESIMPSLDSKTRVCAELADLIESQLNTLEKETFGVVTEAELCEYEDRRDRICQLYAEIFDREAAA
jgi:hypothetical protein